jgi:hypothetical protein
MADRPGQALVWLHWRLPSGRAGKLGPFPRAVAESAVATLAERKKSITFVLSRPH